MLNDTRVGRRTKGIPTSGRVPYGLSGCRPKERAEHGTTQAYALDGDRADDVRLMFEQFLAGVTLGSIARDLNERGRRTAPFKGYPGERPCHPAGALGIVRARCGRGRP